MISENERPTCANLSELVDVMYHEANLPRLDTPFPRLAKRIGGFRPTELTSLLAPTGFGKTGWAMQVSAHHASSGGLVVYWAGEMSQGEVLARLVAQLDSRGLYSWREIADGLVTLEDMARMRAENARSEAAEKQALAENAAQAREAALARLQANASVNSSPVLSDIPRR